ncbi:DUF2087 domain-containing protein [Streptomyces sp. NBC_01571]|uniref:DUF2087 domain-containing protein n=1 Tax=Streptomyces sp. NBC_01571 TaxID=2975883 RepID=UPI002250E47C|nr:DUF2087 domain-containing protein [Streptomyces sp. NBC_01571]MCX4575052.1 DUF2087 domain-containing protein [Streptomyces sp. NBC_01571]
MPTDLSNSPSAAPPIDPPINQPIDPLPGLFAEEIRVRAFAAVALGADTPTKVMEQAGLSPRDAITALRRLLSQDVITDDGGLAVAYGHFRRLARGTRTPPETHGSEDEPTEAVLRTFVRGGRLVRLPAQWQRKLVVLRHIAEQTFEPGVEYPERTVNEKLRVWCEDAPVDHVTLRRYLVDLHHLTRQYGFYWRPAQV